ncbi:MAG: PD-(D/E)XK nuclease family protein [Prevotellaceae bacterium]|nr:PD-(D/E)XK nuclease family protein [Prevotellaceae bacterium]
MKPFLKLVADDLYRKLEGDFKNTTIIFPNKRASLFFNQYLWENSGGKTMWTPEYTSISELFASLSDYTVGDTIYLIVRLFEVYSQHIHPEKSFDQLYSLMETMLSDFQDIDNNMVEPEKLFLNIADLKEMTDFSFLEDEQREAIEQFFGKFFDKGNTKAKQGGQAITPLKTQFKTLWNNLPNIYDCYQKALLNTADGEPLVYEGMLKRRVIEVLRGNDEERRHRIEKRLRSHTYVMVGFNVLNKTELELFRYIKQNHDTKFYWDYDVTYTKPASSLSSKLLSKYEAGQFILENISVLGDEFRGEDFFNNMLTPKQITFIQSPTENAQTRSISEWIETNIYAKDTLKESAVILCNESLLLPVLHSIPPHLSNGDDADDNGLTINVTMGYPLASTPIYSLVQALLELQLRGTTSSGAWRYKYVAAVLNHPFVRKLAGSACYEKLRELTKNNALFPSTEEFADNDILRRLFTRATGYRLTEYLSDIIALVGHSYQDVFISKNNTLQMYKEAIFMAYTSVNRLRSLQEKHETLNVSDETLARLIMQMLRSASIPFHGEPAEGLQVMGLLETRNLDFRNVIMLSVNEGQMPKSDKRPSLIPYTLRAAYGMTTIEKEVSLYAYYYYRLLQRAENITLLYNSSTDGGSKGEMSRFMLQTLAEKNELFAEGQKIELQAFTSASEPEKPSSFHVVKNADVMRRLHERFNTENILSPSAINTYMKCPLKFYFNYVAGLRPDKDVSDDVDKPMFGTIFHYAMQKLYEPYVGKTVSSEQLSTMSNNKDLITQKLNNAFAVNLFRKPEKDDIGNYINYGTNAAHRLSLNGTQLINRHVIGDFVVNQLKADAKMAEQLENEGGSLQILSQEQRYTTMLEIDLHNGESPFSVLLGGDIDRLDLLHSPQGDRIRIVDYKTSNKHQKANTLADLFDPEKCASNYHIMQTLYYCKVITDGTSSYADTAVCPALMYCSKDYGQNFSAIVKLVPPDEQPTSSKPKSTEIEDFKQQYGNEFDNLLIEKIKEIFTPFSDEAAENADSGIFTQCADEQNCKYCDFLTFCRRHPKDTF